MRELLFTRASLVWLLLMSATALSWAMTGISTIGPLQSSSALILLIAFFKVRLVVVHFMEAGHAPYSLRWSCEAVVALACILVITFYLYGEKLVAAGFPVS